jgi:hypothetical protein
MQSGRWNGILGPSARNVGKTGMPFFLLPQRGFGIQPRVAALWRLPWEREMVNSQPQRGCACLLFLGWECRNRVAVENVVFAVSQGSRQSAATLGCKTQPRWGISKKLSNSSSIHQPITLTCVPPTRYGEVVLTL